MSGIKLRMKTAEGAKETARAGVRVGKAKVRAEKERVGTVKARVKDRSLDARVVATLRTPELPRARARSLLRKDPRH